MCDALAVRTYIPEPKRRHPLQLSNQPAAHQRAVRNNRRRMTRAKGKAFQRRRSEVVERTFAHLCETGGSRRSHLRGLANVTKRYLIAAAAHNLGRILRRLTGIGKPKALRCARGHARSGPCPAAVLRHAGWTGTDRYQPRIGPVPEIEDPNAMGLAA